MKKFKNKIIISILAILGLGGYMGADNVYNNYDIDLLGCEKEKILDFYEISVTSSSTNRIEKRVMYRCVVNEEELIEKDEHKRTIFSVHKKNKDGSTTAIISSSPQRKKVEDKWYKVIDEEIKKTDFDLAVKTTLVDKISFTKPALAQTTDDFDFDADNTIQMLSDAKATWSLARDATTATVRPFATDEGGKANCLHSSKSGATYYVRRTDFYFTTSSIGAGQEVTAAKMWVFSAGSGGADNEGDDVELFDNTNNPNINDPLESEDFNDFPAGANIGSRDLTDLTNKNANVSITITDFDVIDMEGNSRVGARLSGDVDNSTPTNTSNLRVDTAGDHPYLEITYQAAAAAGALVDGFQITEF